MKRKEDDPVNRNERLREVLRRGDPGGGEAGLTSEESQAMRRTVLSAVPEPRERFRLAPVFFTVAAAVLSCVVGLSLWRAHDQPDRPAPTVQAARPAVPALPSVPQAQPQPEPPLEVAVVSPPPRPRPMRSTRLMRQRPVEEVKPEEVQETTTRQVQFSAPGGTRIIWLLTTPSAD
jgi:hypothetical protein